MPAQQLDKGRDITTRPHYITNKSNLEHGNIFLKYFRKIYKRGKI